jgi:enamine deaminase RidA (YjgF/YER057c/UK114 family)
MPEDVNEQTDQAFANVEVALKDAGGSGWAQVYSIRTLHVNLDGHHMAAMTRNLRKYCADRPPIWTMYGVAALGAPAMKVEIEVEAYVC